jgi:hypothetical protein
VLGRTRLQRARGVSPQDVARRLDDAERQGWVKREQGAEPAWLWFGDTDAEDDDTQRTVLATIRPDGPDALVVETMSQPRMERALESLDALLGRLVNRGLTQYVDPLQADAGTQHERGKPPTPDEIDPAVAAEIVRQATDAHYRHTLGESVPMLGHRTPRECARTKTGRRKLVAWLKYLENQELHRAPGHEPYDFAWMWRELGIEDQR